MMYISTSCTTLRAVHSRPPASRTAAATAVWRQGPWRQGPKATCATPQSGCKHGKGVLRRHAEAPTHLLPAGAELWVSLAHQAAELLRPHAVAVVVLLLWGRVRVGVEGAIESWQEEPAGRQGWEGSRAGAQKVALFLDCPALCECCWHGPHARPSLAVVAARGRACPPRQRSLLACATASSGVTTSAS